MSMPNPYVRDRLIATRAGLPAPGLLVDLWLDQLLERLRNAGEPTAADLLPAGVSPFSPGDAYDVVALYGRLRRCIPERIAETGRQVEWESAAEAVEGRLAEWLPLALQVLDPDGWLREAALLADACDDGADGASPVETLAEWAEQLLTDLDDADLTAWAVGRQGMQAADLERGLARCAEWLHDNPDRFFPAGVFIQGVGQTIRPDLPGMDLALAGTADKFVLLLDALEEIQERMSPCEKTPPPNPLPEAERGSQKLLPPLSASGRGLGGGVASEALSPSVGMAVLPDDWAGFPAPSLAMAAKTAGGEGLFRRRWRSPDEEAEALLVVAPDGPGAEQVRVNFLADEEVLAALAGRPAWLVGERATIDADGNADFARSALLAARRAGSPLSLCVGEQRQAWNRVRDL